MYDGYTTFHNYYLESLQWHGVGKGDALHFYQGDISVEGPHPISSSGGNSGSGRTRIWMHTDSIQQLQQRAGQRQVRIKNGRPETAVSGGPHAPDRRLYDLEHQPGLGEGRTTLRGNGGVSSAIRRLEGQLQSLRLGQIATKYVQRIVALRQHLDKKKHIQ